MSSVTMRTLRAQGLLETLATLFSNPLEAAELLDSIGFPRSRRPQIQAAGNSHAFWYETCLEVAAGRTAGGLDALLAAAAEFYPHNEKLEAWRGWTGGAAATGSGTPRPDALPAAASGAMGAMPTGTAATARVTPGQRRLRVFLCHATVDKPRVQEAYQRLLALEVDPWLDRESLIGGEDWNLAIERALRETDAVIVFLSQVAISGAGVRHREIKLALDRYDEQPEGAIFLIPVKLEPCELPDRLQRFNALDLFAPDGFDKLARALRARAAALRLHIG